MNNEVNKTNNKTNNKESNTEERRLIYTYSKNQKEYFKNKGIRMVDAGIHKKTNCIYWVFYYDEVCQYFDEWAEIHKTMMEMGRKINNK